MNRFFGALMIFGLVLLAVAIATGWIRYHQADESAIIEIKTGEFERAGEKLADEGWELLEETADSIRQATRESRGAEPSTTVRKETVTTEEGTTTTVTTEKPTGETEVKVEKPADDQAVQVEQPAASDVKVIVR
jgi:hypothetical protein